MKNFFYENILKLQNDFTKFRLLLFVVQQKTCIFAAKKF